MKMIVCLVAFTFILGQDTFEKAKSLYDDENYEDALDILEDLIDDEEKPDYYILAARCAFALNEFEDAYDFLDEIIETQQTNIEVLRFFGDVMVKYADDAGIFSQMSLIKKMRINWENILELDPNDKEVLRLLARFNLFAPSIIGKDEEKGFAYLERLKKLDLKLTLTIETEFYLEEDRYQDAERLLATFEGEDRFFALELKMRIMRKKEDEAGMKSAFEQIDAEFYQTENIETIYNSYGYYLIGKEKAEEAVYVLKRVVDKYPNKANPYDSLGDAYRANGDIENAKKSYRKALEIDPDFSASRQNLEELED